MGRYRPAAFVAHPGPRPACRHLYANQRRPLPSGFERPTDLVAPTVSLQAQPTRSAGRALQMRRGPSINGNVNSPSGIGREASQAAHINRRHFCQCVSMSERARIPLTGFIRRLSARSARWILVSLSLAASPVAAESAALGPSSRQNDQTVSASPRTQENQTNTPDQPRSSVCLTDTRALVVFDRLDRDGDGRLTRADIRRREAGRDRIRVIAPDRHTPRFDLNGDGVATRQEVVTTLPCPGLMPEGQMPTAAGSSHNLEDHERPAD